MESVNAGTERPSFSVGYEKTYQMFLDQIRAELNTGNGFAEFLAGLKAEGMQAVSSAPRKYTI